MTLEPWSTQTSTRPGIQASSLLTPSNPPPYPRHHPLRQPGCNLGSCFWKQRQALEIALKTRTPLPTFAMPPRPPQNGLPFSPRVTGQLGPRQTTGLVLRLSQATMALIDGKARPGETGGDPQFSCLEPPKVSATTHTTSKLQLSPCFIVCFSCLVVVVYLFIVSGQDNQAHENFGGSQGLCRGKALI